MKEYLQNGKFKAILATMGLILMFSYFFAITFIPVAHSGGENPTLISGAFIGILSTIYGFYFGGADKSVQKTKGGNDILGKNT